MDAISFRLSLILAITAASMALWLGGVQCAASPEYKGSDIEEYSKYILNPSDCRDDNEYETEGCPSRS